MPGRAARGYRERHLAKECFGSNRVSKERLQLPAATTTETNPKGRKTVIRKNAHYQKKPPTTPCATTAQHPKENHFSLDKLFQERSSRPPDACPSRLRAEGRHPNAACRRGESDGRLSRRSADGALRSDHYELILNDIPGEIALVADPMVPLTRQKCSASAARTHSRAASGRAPATRELGTWEPC